MVMINIHDAKTHFSKLVGAAMHGEEIIIAKAGKPAAMLAPIHTNLPKRKFGLLKNKIYIANDFDATLPDDTLADFELLSQAITEPLRLLTADTKLKDYSDLVELV